MVRQIVVSVNRKAILFKIGYSAPSGKFFVLVQADRPGDAIQVYQQALTRHPDSVMMRLNLGAILHSLGRDSEARPHLERAHQLAPNGAQAPQIRSLLQQLTR